MAIPSTGSISMRDIQTEFGGVDPINLGDYYTESKTTITTGYNIPSSGGISLADFRGSQKFSLSYIGAISASSIGSTGSASLDISAGAGNLDRWIVIASGMASAVTDIIVGSGAVYTIDSNSVTTAFNQGFETDGDGHRVAIVYRKITNGATSVTVGWSVPYPLDRGHALFVYELTGIPTMGAVNIVTGTADTVANIVLAGSTKRCAILVTTTNEPPAPTSMTNATIAATLGRHTSWYDVNMGAGAVTYTSSPAVNYGCFGGASFPY